MGPSGPKGDVGLKGQKGDMGPAGMPGAKGEPGKSISAPVVAVSPKTLTVNEGESASLQCSVSGNPKPVLKWSKLNSLSQINNSKESGGKLLIKNVAGNDTGKYHCSGVNILGKAHERPASKKLYNKSSENSISQIVFRTDIFFRKLTLGAPV